MTKKRTKSAKKESSGQKRRPWTPKEDAAIRGLVGENGVKQWTLIAENLYKKYNITGRSGKQCRERWHNHLNSGIIKQPWTLEEEYTLFFTHQKIGNKWAEISQDIPGRTDNSIKNHFYSTVRKFYRKLYGKEGTSEDLKYNLKQITDSVLDNLNSERQNLINEEKLTSDSIEDTPIFPDFSDMIITGQHIKMPQDWAYQDLSFDMEQEVLIYPISPYDNSQFY
ncbi:hypothetical protein SteCoe_22322 [Stentor coeruleus]|uniref:Myb-like DNA-binding domain containing protein n=1 Tax=Stentor coeruleus TaxID=5963 RepID=A0A1R2BML2_9CILI|nr:hypothetical protein SteCoe_22322 [Stentor coeruleus]